MNWKSVPLLLGIAMCLSETRCPAVAAAEAKAASAATVTAAPPAFSVRAVSRRAGFLFTDSEPLDVRVQVRGAKSTATVRFTVEESGGPWRGGGTVALPHRKNRATGRGESARGEKTLSEKTLPLRLPGRGLYRLHLAAAAGADKAESETWLAVVFTPPPPDANSPWGIFYTPPSWFDKGNPNGARDAALGHRLLGASWSRLNFWAHAYERVTVGTRNGKPSVAADYALWKSYARALRREGISILGEIAQMPRELSSRPDETSESFDAGPLYNRVKPRDYALWNALIEKLAADFRDEISVWEIWNEPNFENRYWTGTVEDFAELVRHTSGALRRGNPRARIAASGFAGGHDFADKLFQLGMARHIDILSVHYTEEQFDPAAWRALLQKHNLRLPIWNTEEKSEIPLRTLAGGIERSFKFLHVAIGYPEYRPLVRQDMTVLPAGIAFSVGAHCIGTARFSGESAAAPGYRMHQFKRGNEAVAVFKRDPARDAATASSSKPASEPKSAAVTPKSARVTLSVEPLSAGKAITVTDIWGRSRPLRVSNGRATLLLQDEWLFVNGARKLQVLAARAP